jgi:phosphoribosylformylglycinamidine cyclo-ligase
MNKPSGSSNPSKPGLSYLDAGVDIEAGNELVERIKPSVRQTLRPEVLTGLGGFGGLFELDLTRWRQPVLVSGTDGVGTKLMLARQLQSHGTIGIDLVAMCVNDILTCGAEPLFFLDYFACGKLHLDEAQAVIDGIADGCLQAGCALIGGETAEMPGMYGEGEYDLAGFAVGAVERPNMLTGSNISSGHRLLGLASSGPHSNGYSLIRKVIEVSGTPLNALLLDDGSTTEISENPDSVVGEDGTHNQTLGQALIAPTRIYVKPVLDLLSTGGISGMAHITGGGLTENIVRILPPEMGIEIGLSNWRRGAVFDWLQSEGAISDSEMLRTFNCGIGMVLVVEPDSAHGLMARALEHDIQCYDMGCVTQDASGDRVIYRS